MLVLKGEKYDTSVSGLHGRVTAYCQQRSQAVHTRGVVNLVCTTEPHWSRYVVDYLDREIGFVVHSGHA